MTTSWLADKIQQWPTAKLIPYARNARTHSESQVAQIAASIVEFGFTNPILTGADGVIVAGHGRLAAAQKLAMEMVPVVVLEHLSPTQRRALVIADNRIAENAGWDDAMLRNIVPADKSCDTPIEEIRLEKSAVTAIKTPQGDVEADQYVMALGVASAPIARQLGVYLLFVNPENPQLGELFDW